MQIVVSRDGNDPASRLMFIIAIAHAVAEDDTAWAAAAAAFSDGSAPTEEIREALLADTHEMGSAMTGYLGMRGLVQTLTSMFGGDAPGVDPDDDDRPLDLRGMGSPH